MTRLFQRFAFVILITSAARSSGAETNWSSITLTDVVRLLGDQNPKVRAERQSIASARADRRIASAYPNPKVSGGHYQPHGEQTLFTGEHQEQINVEVPVLIPGQRSSRVAKAEADISAAQARVTATTANLTADACASFARLLALQERTAIVSNALTEVTKLKDTISGRAVGGAATTYDLTRVEVEAAVLAGRLEGARAETAAESSQLATFLALTNSLPIATGTLEPWQINSEVLSNSTARVFSTPAALAASREADAAEAAIKAARRNRWPELALEAGHGWTRHPFGSADFIGLSVEIPIFDTRRGQLDKARAEASAAEARRDAAIAETDATVRRLLETLRQRQSALRRYESELQPRLGRLKEMSAEAYMMGRHTILELIDAEQARREVMLEHIEVLSALIEAQIRLLGITGQLPSFLQSSAPR